jgi:hypothetical protein
MLKRYISNADYNVVTFNSEFTFQLSIFYEPIFMQDKDDKNIFTIKKINQMALMLTKLHCY